MAASIVTFENFAILLGSTELSSDVFFGIDPDGDTIERSAIEQTHFGLTSTRLL